MGEKKKKRLGKLSRMLVFSLFTPRSDSCSVSQCRIPQLGDAGSPSLKRANRRGCERPLPTGSQLAASQAQGGRLRWTNHDQTKKIEEGKKGHGVLLGPPRHDEHHPLMPATPRFPVLSTYETESETGSAAQSNQKAEPISPCCCCSIHTK